MSDEQTLSGGNASGPVVRVGDTVRKPWTSASPHVRAYVTALRARCVDAPAHLGHDEKGRQTIEFVPGTLALERDPLTPAALRRVGSMVRAIHDASQGYEPAREAVWESAIPAPGSDLMCHNDLAPWNLIIGERWVFIDWDAAAPSTRLWDLAYACVAFTMQQPNQGAHKAASDLAAFVDGYAAERQMRTALPHFMSQRAAAMLELLSSSHATGREPWASMFSAGHGAHWAAVAAFLDAHQPRWHAALTTSGLA